MGPEVLAIASLAGSVISAGVGAIGAIQQGQAASAAATYRAQVARNNETVAAQNAQRAAAVGSQQAENRDLRTRAVVGQIEAAQSASGIDTESPSSTSVRESARQVGRLDTMTIFNNAQAQIASDQAQGAGYGAEAGLDTATARSASTAAGVTSFSSLLGGATSFADKWLKFQTTGVEGFTGSLGTGGLI